MVKLINLQSLSLTIFIYSILVTHLSYPKKVSPNSEHQNSPGKLENSIYVVMSFVKDIGCPKFFEYEDIENALKIIMIIILFTIHVI